MLQIMIITLCLVAGAVAQPYEPNVLWERIGAGDSSLYGAEILALGDQNDDGFNDWAVYAQGRGNAPEGHPNEPRVEFFHGGNPPDTEPYMVRVADRATEISVRGARALGDLNDDGYEDWYIYTSYVNDPDQRHIYKIYFGGPGLHLEPDLILTSPIFSGYTPIRDFNGDGFDDLLLSEGENNYAAVYFGGNPMDTLSDWTRSPILIAQGVGDLNHDGYSDFISDTGPVVCPQIFLGSIQPDTLPTYSFPNLHPWDPTIVRDLNGDLFDDLCLRRSGWGGVLFGSTLLDTIEDAHLDFPCSGSGPQKIVTAGDFNHDGFNDVVMLHEWCENSGFGILTLHLGAVWINPEAAFVIYGWTEPLNLIGIKRATGLGDVNDDGVDDLAIGANDDVVHAGWRGKVVVLSGDTSLRVAADDPRAPLLEEIRVEIYPNPFNSFTTIRVFVPPNRGEIELAVHNLLGQKVRSVTLRNVLTNMTYSLNAAEFSTGIYLMTVTSGAFQTTSKLVVLK